MLDEFGCKLVGPATNAPRALELIGKESIEIAVLDLNLGLKDRASAPTASGAGESDDFLRGAPSGNNSMMTAC
jgi:hypothetical protein